MLHPILKERRRIFLYLILWVGIGKLLAAVLVYGGRAPLGWALLFSLPLCLLLGFQSLGSWYLVRSMPGETTPTLRLLASWAAAALVSVGLWTGIGLVWASVLLPGAEVDDARRREILLAIAPVLLVVGALGFIAAVLGHYMLFAFERSRKPKGARSSCKFWHAKPSCGL